MADIEAQQKFLELNSRAHRGSVFVLVRERREEKEAKDISGFSYSYTIFIKLDVGAIVSYRV